MTDRRTLTTKDKLKIMARYARCPLCGEKLGPLEGVDFDHIQALGLGGTDDLENIQPVHHKCHVIKTNGTKATTAGSDKHMIAKARRVKKRHEEFCRRVLAKTTGETQRQDSKRKRKIASRPFQKRAAS